MFLIPFRSQMNKGSERKKKEHDRQNSWKFGTKGKARNSRQIRQQMWREKNRINIYVLLIAILFLVQEQLVLDQLLI